MTFRFSTRKGKTRESEAFCGSKSGEHTGESTDFRDSDRSSEVSRGIFPAGWDSLLADAACPRNVAPAAAARSARAPTELVSNSPFSIPAKRDAFKASLLAGMAGFEPTTAGVKVLCLTAWRHPKEKRRDACPGAVGWVNGVEPSASRATIWRSNQLSYTHRNRRLLHITPYGPQNQAAWGKNVFFPKTRPSFA